MRLSRLFLDLDDRYSRPRCICPLHIIISDQLLLGGFGRTFFGYGLDTFDFFVESAIGVVLNFLFDAIVVFVKGA